MKYTLFNSYIFKAGLHEVDVEDGGGENKQSEGDTNWSSSDDDDVSEAQELADADSDWASSGESAAEKALEKDPDDLIDWKNSSEGNISEHSNKDDIRPPELSIPLPAATSSIRRGLELVRDVPEKPHGLFRFFKKATGDEYKEYLAREDDSWNAKHDEDRNKLEALKHLQKENKRERACLRQQQRRKRKKEEEVKMGQRSPGGTKKRVS
jgi:hypothetical protein